MFVFAALLTQAMLRNPVLWPHAHDVQTHFTAVTAAHISHPYQGHSSSAADPLPDTGTSTAPGNGYALEMTPWQSVHPESRYTRPVQGAAPVHTHPHPGPGHVHGPHQERNSHDD